LDGNQGRSIGGQRLGWGVGEAGAGELGLGGDIHIVHQQGKAIQVNSLVILETG